MPGFTSNVNATATTPDRKSHFVFDVDELIVQQPTWAIEREREAIVPVYDGSEYTSNNVELVPGQGWRAQSIHGYANTIHETAAPITTMTVPPGYTQQPTWSKSTMTGATYSGDVTDSGDQFYNRLFQASGDLTDGNYNLQSDQDAFPSAVDGMTNAPMFRVGYANSSVVAETIFSFEVRGNPKSAPDYVGGYYFNGVLGWDPNPSGYQNTGYYWIGFRGDGRCELWAYLTNGTGEIWTLVRQAWYCDPSQVHNRIHRVTINPVKGQYPDVSGGFILFRFTNSGEKIQDPPQSSYLTVIGRDPSSSANGASFQFKWTAPGIYASAAEPAYPARVDSRQDLDVAFQQAVVTYHTTANLFDQLFQVPFYLDTQKPFKVVYWGFFPSGCSINAQILAATTPDSGNPAYTPLGAPGPFGTTFTPIAGQRFYGVNFTYSNSGTDSAVLAGYRVFRDGVGILVSPGSFEPAFQPTTAKLRTSAAVGPVSITLADNDPSTSNASFGIEDFAGDMPRLQERGDFPMIITTDFKVGNHTGTVKLHRGYARLPESEEIGDHAGGGWKTGLAEQGDIQAFNYGFRFKARIQCTGMWQRLTEALMPVRWNFAIGPDSTQTNVVPSKVTDAIRQLFYFAGYDDSQLSIPDLDIRLYPTGDGDGLVIEPQSSIQELIVRWCKDYLGGYINPEPNAGVYGKWLVLQQLTEPYAFLTSFTPTAPAAGKILNNLNSYGNVIVDGQSMQQAPMFKRTKWTPKPPEANYVISYGAQENGGGDSSGLLSVLAFNTDSFKFSGFPDAPNPDPDSIDWLARPRPIWQYLPTYAQSDASDWFSPLMFATRRTYDVSCHGRLRKTFIAPLVIVQDPGHEYWRPLRFYDPVYVEGFPCLIRSVLPMWVKDDHQLAAYTVEQIIGDVPAQVSRTDGPTSYRDALRRNSLGALSEPVTNPRQFAAEKRSYGMAASTFGIGCKRTAPIQETDGSFKWMLDYDPLG